MEKIPKIKIINLILFKVFSTQVSKNFNKIESGTIYEL